MRLVNVAAVLAAVGCGTVDTAPTSGVVTCAESDKITLFADNDKDGYGAPDTPKVVCPPVGADGLPSGEIPRGFAANDDDCDDFRPNVNPATGEVCDGLDNDCDTETDEGLRESVFFIDGDGDGFGNPELDLSVSACAAPAGFVDSTLIDCNDGNAAISPVATEICNFIDDNCNERVDDADPGLDLATAFTWWADADGDSYGGDETFLVQCEQPSGQWVLNADDCQDADVSISPSAQEVCNHIDDDCDWLIDDTDDTLLPDSQSLFYADEDLDGFGDPDVPIMACFLPWFATTNADDCDDLEPLLGLPAGWVFDNDLDGFGAGVVSDPSCDPPAAGFVLEAKGIDCNDDNLFISPKGNEICDGIDNDCDVLLDDADPSLNPAFANTFFEDDDGDGYGNDLVSVNACTSPLGYTPDDTDCNDQRGDINPGASEVCDGGDNDCDDLVDDADPSNDSSTADTYYFDSDGDGYGNPGLPTQTCGQPADYVTNGLDCDDMDPALLAFDAWVVDQDGDGVGAGEPSAVQCTPPGSGYVPLSFGVDCADLDDNRYPGNDEICSNGIDEDCSGADQAC